MLVAPFLFFCGEIVAFKKKLYYITGIYIKRCGDSDLKSNICSQDPVANFWILWGSFLKNLPFQESFQTSV